ncbi:MAG: YlbF family regulator [Lachnospiraceae bacterium]|nr:YlbF family regulator [Lachnospiraceae bacterium]
MNLSIEKATLQFAADIKNTEIYKEYRKNLNNVKQDAELYEKTNEYRLKSFELQTLEQTDDLLDKIDRLEQEYGAIIDNPVASDFLRAELSFCRMMQDINNCITTILDFE